MQEKSYELQLVIEILNGQSKILSNLCEIVTDKDLLKMIKDVKQNIMTVVVKCAQLKLECRRNDEWYAQNDVDNAHITE